jgi:hypothetical protein
MAEHVYHFNHAGDPDRTDVLHGRVAGTTGLHAVVLAKRAVLTTFSAKLPSFNVVGRAARPGSTTSRTACVLYLCALFDLHQASLLGRSQQSGHLVASACQYSSEVYLLACSTHDIESLCNDACVQKMALHGFSIDFVLKALQYSHGFTDWLADSHGDQATKGVADACHCGNRTRSVNSAP